ncbi:MAG: hypothetical protein ABSC11_09515 [Smithella sp.]
MKKITFIMSLTMMSLLLLSLISYAEKRVDITGHSEKCPSGFKLLRSGSRIICKQTDRKIVDVYYKSAEDRSSCSSGYESKVYDKVRWCIKRGK